MNYVSPKWRQSAIRQITQAKACPPGSQSSVEERAQTFLVRGASSQITMPGKAVITRGIRLWEFTGAGSINLHSIDGSLANWSGTTQTSTITLEEKVPMKATDEKVDYCGEHLGLRLAAGRCQAIVRDYEKKTWSIYGAPDSYPREQKYWTSASSGFSIVRMAVQVLRNEVPSDLLDVLTGKKNFASAAGCRAVPRIDAASAKQTRAQSGDSQTRPSRTRTAISVERGLPVAGPTAAPPMNKHA
jgi:hypothetical protein